VQLGKFKRVIASDRTCQDICGRVMGSRQFVVPDIFETDIQVNDVFMLCSDGVSGMVEDAAIKEILVVNQPENAAVKLVEAANRAGGKDNSTAVVFAFDQLPLDFPARCSLTRLMNQLFNKVYAGGV